MTRVALTLAFDGTRYCGWQAQKNGLSVQTAVCEAAAKVYGALVPVTGCSRTDAGVHACGFVCHMDVPFVIPPDALPLALNRALPPDIAVRAACRGRRSRRPATKSISARRKRAFRSWN